VSDIQLALEEAQRCADREDWAAAVTVLRRAPATPEVLDRLAYYMSLGKDYAGALAVLDDYRRLRPDDARGYYATGYQHYRQQHFRDAIGWFEKAIERRPDHLRARFCLMNSLNKLRRTKEAVSTASEILGQWHHLESHRRTDTIVYASACYVLGKDTLGKRPELALEYFEAARACQPDDAWYLWGAGRALNALGRPGEALPLLERAASLKPGDPWIELEKTRALGLTGNHDRAVEALGTYRGRARSWEAERAGQVARRLDAPTLAVEFFGRAVADTRGNPRTIRELAAARKAAGLTDEPDEPLRWGRVTTVRPEKNFGFLVDERDGLSRHFRLSSGPEVSKGDRVQFTPVEREKGPAAELVGHAPRASRHTRTRKRSPGAAAPAQ